MARGIILLTIGDPNGLGPELFCRLWSTAWPDLWECALLVLAPPGVLEECAHNLGLPGFWNYLTALEPLKTASLESGQVYLHPLPELGDFPFQPGEATVQGGRAAGASLDLACQLLQQGVAQAVVTCPLNKKMLNLAGFNFPGHTEFLAQRFGLTPDQVCMHLWGPSLRVSLVTTHPPLKTVPGLLNQKRIVHCLDLTWNFLKHLGLGQPIAVCGLNPHAGEGGTIGSEEKEVIIPAVQAAKEQGIKVQGPLPADTVFYRACQGEFAAVLAMYHDQGLAPLKVVHFKEAVNVTLGLPIVRTSVDHGTGYDLVGKGIAGVESLRQAIVMARRLIGFGALSGS